MCGGQDAVEDMQRETAALLVGAVDDAPTGAAHAPAQSNLRGGSGAGSRAGSPSNSGPVRTHFQLQFLSWFRTWCYAMEMWSASEHFKGSLKALEKHTIILPSCF